MVRCAAQRSQSGFDDLSLLRQVPGLNPFVNLSVTALTARHRKGYATTLFCGETSIQLHPAFG